MRALYEGPFIGLGLGIDVHGEDPDWRALLSEGPRVFDFLEVFTRGDGGIAAEVRALAGPDFPIIYHHEGLELVYPGPIAEKALTAAQINLKALGAPWCIEELAYREIEGRYLDFFMPALLTEESAIVAAEKIRAANAVLPCPVTPENPPYQLAVGELHVLEYMQKVGEAADVPLILDLGHLYSYQICVGAEPLDALDKLDLDRVIELHVAGANIADVDGVPIYEDTHGADRVPDLLLEMLETVGSQCKHLRAVTLEVEDASRERVLEDCARVNAVLDQLGVRHGA